MILLGKRCFVFESTGKTCNVSPFDPALGTALDAPIVDAAITYNCPFTLETYILIIHNALYIPFMEYNLILPFIMREGDLIVNNIPKMHCENPTIGDQCILFKDIYLRIIAQWDFFLLKF